MKAFSTDYFYDDETKHEILPSEGMDLRDYFAARAMQGMLSSYEKGDSLKVQLLELGFVIQQNRKHLLHLNNLLPEEGLNKNHLQMLVQLLSKVNIIQHYKDLWLLLRYNLWIGLLFPLK